MYKQKSFLAIIPARGGSKGLIDKNIIKIKGRPLIDFTIHEALKSKYLDKVIVNTDSKEISRVAELSGAEVPFLRPEKYAMDHSKTIDSIIYFIENLVEKYDYLVLLQPTQPLRTVAHIDEAIEEMINNNKDSLVSVNEVKENPVLMRTINKEYILENVINMNSTIRRQEFPEYFKVNGAIYINKIKDLNLTTSFNDNVFPFIMNSKFDLDIDEQFDLEVFKLILSLENNYYKGEIDEKY